MKLRVATRKSQLALTQTRSIITQLKALHPHLDIEEVPMLTQGDREQHVPLMNIGGKGLFVGELENCVASGQADFAVHSLKDVPGDRPMRAELKLVCFPQREDPRDALISRDGCSLDDLPKHAHVGTTSLRRSTQLHARRPDSKISTLRGNVDTRIRKLNDGQFDAIVLAVAGIQRLGLRETLKFQVLPMEVSVPAVGQGTLALQARAEDSATHALLAPLNHLATALLVAAERALLLELRGNCFSPIGGVAYLSDDQQRLCMQAIVASYDGRQMLQARTDVVVRGNLEQVSAAQAEQLGRDTANNLLQRGARELIDQAEIAAIHRESHSN